MRSLALALVAAAAASAGFAAFADDKPAAPAADAPTPVGTTVQLDADALLPGETVLSKEEAADMGLTVQEMPDGSLRDSLGRTWTPERMVTAHERPKDTFVIGQDGSSIEGTPVVTPDRVAAHDRFQLPPIDGGIEDKEFAAWRAQLQVAIKSRDWNQLKPFVSPDVNWSYGEVPGLNGFQGRWKPESSTSTLWAELDKVFDNGGTFGKGERGDVYFEAPFWSAWWPASYDPVEWSLLRGTNVALLADPKEGASKVMTLDWAIVKREQPSTNVPPRGWTRVRTGDGKNGYVKDESLETPFGYRAICDKHAGKWLVTAFITGE